MTSSSHNCSNCGHTYGQPSFYFSFYFIIFFFQPRCSVTLAKRTLLLISKRHVGIEVFLSLLKKFVHDLQLALRVTAFLSKNSKLNFDLQPFCQTLVPLTVCVFIASSMIIRVDIFHAARRTQLCRRIPQQSTHLENQPIVLAVINYSVCAQIFVYSA